MKTFTVKNVAFAVAATLGSLWLSGCAMGDAAPSSITVGPLQGKAFGGSVPVVGGTVTLWQTQTGATANAGGPSAYGSKAKVLATTLTDQFGFFNFSASAAYTCAAGEFSYLTVTGGNPGFFPNGVGTNPNLVLMTAIGPCANLSSSTQLYVSEVTTTAAAYALSNFLSVQAGSGPGLQQVYVGAPANNSTTGACTVTSGKTTACSGAGLSHAFTNAYNLVDAVTFSGNAPSGNARTQLPVAFGSATLNANSAVPQVMINRVGNILSMCVNSTGGTAGDGVTPADTCNTLFTNTTPPGGTAPTDTLSAAINLAKYPFSSAAAVTALNGMVSATPAFLPDFSTAPANFGMFVSYYGSVGTSGANFGNAATAQQGYVYALALDAADNVYVSAGVGGTGATGGETGGTVFHGMTFNGVGIFNTTIDSALLNPGYLATDTLGNVFATNNSTVAPASQIHQISATTGTATLLTATNSNLGVAVDRFNNVYVVAGTTTPKLYQLPPTSTTPYTPVQLTALTVRQGIVALDANQNIWTVQVGGTTDTNYILPNSTSTTTTAAGTYTASNLVTITTGDAQLNSLKEEGGITFDSFGNAYSPSNLKFEKFVPTLNMATPPVITGVTTTLSTTTNGQGALAESDGANNVWYSNYSSTGTLTQVTSTNFYQIIPCFPVSPAAGQEVCSTQLSTGAYNATQFGRTLQIDSAGDVWISAGAATASVTLRGVVVEMIGTAAPTYPQMSLGLPGVAP